MSSAHTPPPGGPPLPPPPPVGDSAAAQAWAAAPPSPSVPQLPPGTQLPSGTQLPPGTQFTRGAKPHPPGVSGAGPQPIAVAAPQGVPVAAPLRPAAAPRPIPAGPRPIPVGSAPAAGELAIDPERTEELPPDPTEKAVKSAPPWLVSMVVHMVLLLVLALLTMPRFITRQIAIESDWAEKLGEQLIQDKLESPESLDMELDVPVLAFDESPVLDPLAAPPMLDIVNLDATSAVDNIEAPSIGLALTGREPGMKKALLAAYGGNATTEEAVRLGLEWLKRQQMRDGGWSLTGPYPDGAHTENRCSATAMALLAFQGAGHTHLSGDYQPQVKRGWDFLLKMQNKDGFFEHDGGNHQRLYAQAQASIAICELYGMTKDEAFKRPAQLALDFAHKAQAPQGGWRYEPKVDSDVSVTGWYVMALQSGMMAGLEVQSPTLDNIHKFLDSCTRNGVHYSYQAGGTDTVPMTAEALLCRQYLGWKHNDERLQAGIEYLLANPIDYARDENVYYWYYATQAIHHMDGEPWNRWNRVMRQEVPEHQVKTGSDRGSWNPHADRWGAPGGRLYTTCLSIYLLEVYYRHLPIYKWRLQ